MAQTRLPGTDGYYLLDQAGEVLKSGSLRINNHDPTPFLVAGMIRLGLAPELSVKLLLLLGMGAWLWLGRRAVSVFFFWLTPLFLYHLIQFPKLSLSLLLAVGAFSSLSQVGKGVLGALSFLFHPLGPAGLLLGEIEKLKKWIPWVGSAVLSLSFPLLGHLWRGQGFSLAPVGYKLLVNPHFPLVLRIIVAGWIAGLVLNPSQAWLALGLLAPNSSEELIGTPERWMLALILFSAWVFRDQKAKLVLASGAPFLAWLMLMQMPHYDYSLMDEVIAKSRELDLKMLVVDQTGKFYFTAKTGKDAYFFEPEDDWEKKAIWRVVKHVSPGELFPYMGRTCGPGSSTWFVLRPDAFLIREDCWEQLRSGVQKEENEDLYDRVWDNGANPYKKRPVFLQKRQK